MKENNISCDECKAIFTSEDIEFKHANTTIENKQFEIVYYKCPTCGKPYVVCMLDYWGRKLQDKYIRALDSYRAACGSGISNSKLQQKLTKVETLKTEAMAYQNETLHIYGNLIPEGIFES